MRKTQDCGPLPAKSKTYCDTVMPIAWVGEFRQYRRWDINHPS